MQFITGLLTGILGSLCASFLFPPFRVALSEGWHTLRKRLDKNAFDLSDSWKAIYSEPDEDGQWEDVAETIKLKHYGETIKGTSKIENPEPRQFIYQLRVVHDMVIGHYRVHGGAQGAISGSGVLLLRVSDNRQTMDGRCIWLDRDTKQIEESEIKLERIG